MRRVLLWLILTTSLCWPQLNPGVALATKETKQMPRLVGLRLSDARERLGNNPVEIVEVQTRAKPGTVINQRPGVGTRLQSRDRVVLYVAVPPEASTEPEVVTTPSKHRGHPSVARRVVSGFLGVLLVLIACLFVVRRMRRVLVWEPTEVPRVELH